MNGIPFLATAILCLATALGLLWVNSRRLINQAIGITSLFVSLSFLSIYAVVIVGTPDQTAYSPALLFWLRMNGATYAFVPWTLWLMKEAIVAGHSSLFLLIKRSGVMLLGSCLLACLCFSNSYIHPDAIPNARERGAGYVLFTTGMYALTASILLGAHRAGQKLSGVRRIEMQFFLLNACVTGLIIIAVVVVRRIYHVSALMYVPSVLVTASIGVMVWAVSYHRIFDARQVMISMGQRLALLILLVGGALGASDLLSQLTETRTSLVLGIIIAGIGVFYCNAVTRVYLGLDPDRILAGPRADIIALARTEFDPEILRSKFATYLRNWCQAELVAVVDGRVETQSSGDCRALFKLLGLSHQGWVTPEHLQRLRPVPAVDESADTLSKLGLAAVVAARSGSDAPTLLLALGPKHSGRPYTYPDIMVLLNLAELMDNILTHAILSAHTARLAQMESAAMISRSLAHDLNNLTTPVATYLLHSQDRAAPGSAEADVYDAALHSVKVMNDYIRESLFFSCRLIPEFKEFEPALSLASVVRLAHERAARRGITLESRCEVPTRLTVDPVLFQRLALNLVNNAIDASPPGAAVTIEVGLASPAHFRLSVADQGPGVPAENLKRIFDPYFTTKDTVRGLGLGLAICRKIVDLHGGNIEARNAPGRGAVFTAFFPLKRVTEGPAREPARDSPAKAGLLERLASEPRPA